MRKILEIPV